MIEDLVETVWRVAVVMVLIITIPIWFIPYTVYKIKEKIK
jgi:hypothetical protein